MRCVLLFLLCCSIFFSGCASKYGTQITKVKHYPDCYSPIAELRHAEEQFNKTVAGGTILGALTGAIIGVATTGKASGALAGAAIGAAAGGMTGYAAAKYNEHKDEEARYVSYINDMDRDMHGATGVQLAANNARKCYEERFNEAVRDYQAKMIAKEEFREKYQEIRNGLTEASKILGKVAHTLGEKEQQYYSAITEEAQRAGAAVPQPRKVAAVMPQRAKGKKSVTPKAKQVGATSQPTPATLQGLANKNAEISMVKVNTIKEQESVDATIAVFDKNAQDLLASNA